MKQCMYWVMAIVLWQTTLCGEIIETMTFATLKEHVDQDTLIVLDIDNTLLELPQELGSDQWFYHRMMGYIEQGMSKVDALEKALPEWNAVQMVTDVRMCEEGTDKVVAELQEKGYTVIGLTTRGLAMSSLAVQQLAKLNIDLSKTAPSQEQIFFTNYYSMYPETPHGCLFRGGILFTAGSDKEGAFEKLLAKLDLHPKKVVFINDKKSHLEPVGRACEKLEIPFVGLRYGATDERVKNYDASVADLQWEAFAQFMTDSEARTRLAVEE